MFRDVFPGDTLQFIPHPGKHNRRMQKQLGAMLYDTRDYKSTAYKNLDDFIEKHKEPDTDCPTIKKIFINQKFASEIFERLELMGITGSSLFMNADGVVLDIINAYNYNPKTSYLRDIKSAPLDDTKI